MIRFFKELFFSALVAVLVCSCGETVEPGGIFRESQLQRLLAGDSARSWILTEKRIVGEGNCETDQILSFIAVTSGKTLFLDLDTARCIDSIHYLPPASSWAFKRAGQKLFVDSLFLKIPGDSLYVKVNHITSNFLDISYHLRFSVFDSVLVEESYIRY